MAKKYQVYGFTYIADKNEFNVLTGTKEEAEEEKEICCFNGYAVFKHKGKRYLMRYPKIQELTYRMKKKIEHYCGYVPESGEYGVIAMTFGKITESK